MFDGWRDFFLLAGSAAAVLIGLSFVVITLMQDRPRSSVLQGSKLYMGPVVLGESFVLVLCAAATVPGISARPFAVIAGVIAVWGLVRAVMSARGILRLRLDERIYWSDTYFYGWFPAAAYLALGADAVAFWVGCRWAYDGLAALTVAGLLIGIRNEWDLITWIAPRGGAETDEVG